MCGARGGRTGGPTPPPEKSQNIGFSSNTGPDPLKSRSYHASIQSSLPSSTKKTKQKNTNILDPRMNHALFAKFNVANMSFNAIK